MRKILVVACLVMTVILSGCGLLPNGEVAKGVYLENQDISGYTRDKVVELIKNENQKKNPQIELVDDVGRKVLVDGRAVGLTLDVDKTVETVYETGYEADVFSMLKSRLNAILNPVNNKLTYTVNEPMAENYLKEYAKTINQEGADAHLTVEGGKVILHPAKVGKVVRIKETLANLKELLGQGGFGELKISIDRKAQPKINEADLVSFNTILGEYTTYYDPSAENRSHNILIATDKINGYILKAGQNFSFNEVVGERTAEAGYDDAPVMVDGKLEPGIGGGICQVSSTLFNASLLSGMEIVERTSHFAPVGYIDIGRDATVAYGYLDYQFRNPFTSPVYLLAQAAGGEVTIYIIGNAVSQLKSVDISVGNETKIPNKTINKKDPTIKEKKIEKGYEGRRLDTVRTITYQDGSTKTDSFESVYEPVDTIIIN